MNRSEENRDLRYPVGTFRPPTGATAQDRERWIGEIAALPVRLRAAVSGLAEAQLDMPYRPDGWTVRQVVHHVADSHLNAYVRFRLAMTEQSPAIKPYDEKAWAGLPDAFHAPVGVSLALVDALHERWVMLLRSVEAGDFARTLFHPAHDRELSLDWMLAQYAWHGRHHVAHITSLREREGWEASRESADTP
jgi:hypothetical protein